jgi:type I restriction enzyme S subunit
MKEIQLGSLFLEKGGSVNPAKFKDESFEYYSIPAYDKGIPEISKGSEIGSSKKIFQPNDVLLSRIVPHIRRCWIVGKHSGLRQIGSGEWITFRSAEIHPPFLRYHLMSNDFNHKFLKTIKGVGGSLMRADPKQVARFKILVPPLDQQKKIAAILDAADAYRQKTKAVIEKYDELTQSLFLEMFGDPFTNRKGFPVVKLSELCEEIFLGLTSKVDYVDEGGFPLIRATDINKGVLSFDKVKHISKKQHGKLTSRRITKKGDVLISKSGSLGTCAIVHSDREFSTYESIFTVRTKTDLMSNIFLVYLVRNEGFQVKLLGKQVGGTVAHLNLKMFRDFEFPIPPIAEQSRFTEKALRIENQKIQAQTSLVKAEDLFNSLLQRAFKGELV